MTCPSCLKLQAEKAELATALSIIKKAHEGYDHAECDHASNAPAFECQMFYIATKALSSSDSLSWLEARLAQARV
mgnify:FL=1